PSPTSPSPCAPAAGWACSPGVSSRATSGCRRSATPSAGRSLPVPPPGAPGPFGLAEADRVRALLTGAGLVDVEIESVDEAITLGHDAADAYALTRGMSIVRGLTDDLDAASRTSAFDTLRATLDAHQTDSGVLFGSSAWLITARRR